MPCLGLRGKARALTMLKSSPLPRSEWGFFVACDVRNNIRRLLELRMRRNDEDEKLVDFDSVDRSPNGVDRV